MSEILRVMAADDDEAIARTVVLGLKTLGCAARSAPDVLGVSLRYST